MNRKQISILIVLIACLAVPIYFVRNYSGGAVMEKDSTVYLVLGTARDGYRYSVFGMALDLVKQFFRAPLSPDDVDNSILIIRVDPSATDAHTAKYINERDKVPEHVTVYQDGIYAECAGVKLCKWTNNGFQSVPEDENRAFGGAGHLDRVGADNSMVNGWMRRYVGGAHAGFQIDREGQFRIVIEHRPENGDDSNVKVQIFRPSRAPETLFQSDGKVHFVSRATYARYFRK